MVEINARKRDERLAEDRQKLEKLINIKKCLDRGETKEFQKRMRQNLINNREELEVLNGRNTNSKTKSNNLSLFFLIEINAGGKKSHRSRCTKNEHRRYIIQYSIR